MWLRLCPAPSHSHRASSRKGHNTMATFKYKPVRAGAGAQLVGCLLIMHETLHGSPVANKLGMVIIPEPRKWGQEDQKLRVFLGYTGTQRPV